MNSTIYIKLNRLNDHKAVQHFCDAMSTQGEWLNETVYRIDVNETQRLQFNLSLASFEEDMGSSVSAVVGFNEDQLMFIALEAAQRYSMGRIIDLDALLLLSVWHKDLSLIQTTQLILNSVSSELIDTLKMYLLTGNNAILASEHLYLHRNTFNYRLNKFVDKTRINVRNPHIAQFLSMYYVLIERI